MMQGYRHRHVLQNDNSQTHHLWLDKELFNQPSLLILFAAVASNCAPIQLVAEEVNVRLQS